MTLSRLGSLALPTLGLTLALSCGGGGEAAANAQASESKPVAVKAPGRLSTPLSAAERSAQGLPAQLERSRDPRVLSVSAALERADLGAARRALLALDESQLETLLLGARLAALENDGVTAVRLLEEARRACPDQAVVLATAAEIHAAAGRLSSAEAELREGLARCGPTAELSRARGVLALSREGGVRAGLEHLLAAREADPDLPFLARPLAQAHLLLGREALAQNEALDAIGHARAALAAEPGDEDARMLQADALSAAGELDAALATYEELLASGAEVKDTLALLCQRAATAALVQGARDLAVERHLRARELGLPAADLGFGAALLCEESERALEAGAASHQLGDLARAAELFERALRLDPESLAAANHLGVVRFKQGAHAEAARLWQSVLETARREDLELPEPVHLNLARALMLSDRAGEARELLEQELTRDPEGAWSAATRALLSQL